MKISQAVIYKRCLGNGKSELVISTDYDDIQKMNGSGNNVECVNISHVVVVNNNTRVEIKLRDKE